MDAFIPFVLFCQALGAFIGAASTIWGEFSYLRAMRDGRIDHAERMHLRSIAHGLRFGMSLLLISSFALVVIAYLSKFAVQPVLTSSYWTLIILAIIVIYVSWALSRNRISFALGSAIAFSAWWFLAYLTVGLMPTLSFGSTIAFFVLATAIFYAILQYTRMLASPKK
ncbi:MAG: hypothetical protein ACHQU0_03020 [Candidatus Paceibacteria bacterium]